MVFNFKKITSLRGKLSICLLSRTQVIINDFKGYSLPRGEPVGERPFAGQ